MLERSADRRSGWLAVAAGTLLVLAVQVSAPVGVPLYDGVVVQEPYRFLHPTGDAAGSPTSYTGTKPVDGSASPIFAAATSENPPQAQLIAQRGAFELAPGTTALQVAITAVEPPGIPTDGAIAGNVYRFSVASESGTPLDVKTCSGCLSLLLRAPDGTEAASIRRFAGGAWHEVETVHAGIVDLYQTNAAAMGDYAVITTSEGVPSEDGTVLGLDPVVALGGGAVIVLLLIGMVLLLRVKQAPPASEPAPRTRIPSKRKGRR